MKARIFTFQNQSHVTQTIKQHPVFKYNLKQQFIFSSVCIVSIFCILHLARFAQTQKILHKTLIKSSRLDLATNKHSLNLMLSIKGLNGPQLKSIQVSLHAERSFKKILTTQKQKLKKQILFILSGQSKQAFLTQKQDFEKQIQFHLNAFLPRKLVHGVQIHTNTLTNNIL